MYQLSTLKNYSNILHGISSVKDGNMSFMWGGKEEVVKNRKRFLDTLGISVEDCVAMEVLHGTEIVGVGHSHRNRGMLADDAIESDGLVTNTSGLYLFLLTADCLPILFYDPVKRVCGLVHAGWKSTDGKIVERTIQVLTTKYNSDPGDILVGIGPGIHKESYIFPASVAEKRFPSAFRQRFMLEWGECVTETSRGEISLDLVGYNIRQLAAAGIGQDHIFTSGIDTTTSLEFFSHYRSTRLNPKEKEGRFATVLGMK